jgi:hypothetical protein
MESNHDGHLQALGRPESVNRSQQTHGIVSEYGKGEPPVIQQLPLLPPRRGVQQRRTSQVFAAQDGPGKHGGVGGGPT